MKNHPIQLILPIATLFLVLGGCSSFSITQFTELGFTLSSPDLRAGESISADQYANQFGCEAKNQRPVLEWTRAPEGTKSFAVTFYDKDAPTGSGFWHWLITDIPSNVNRLSADSLPEQAKERLNDAGQTAYFGPCPPIGRKHRYIFTVYALDTVKLSVPPNASSAMTGFFIHNHMIDKATLSVKAGPRT